MSLEVVTDNADRCGEGPIWDPDESRLLWTDIPSDVVYQHSPGNQGSRVLVRGINLSTIALAGGGKLIFGGAAGLTLWTHRSSRLILSHYQGEPLAINDMIATPAGGLYFGTIYWDAGGMDKPGRLYLIDSAGAVRVVDEGIELANGLGFSPDAKTLYFVDSAPRRVYAYDHNPADGALSRRRVFAKFKQDDGIPDGMTVDADGHVWCAMWYGSQIIRLDPDGKIERRIPIPALQVSSLAFGGDNLDELYVTTAAEPWPSHLAPRSYRADAPDQGGALYRLRMDIRGKPEYRAACTAHGVS